MATRLSLPLDEERARALRAGDEVLLRGRLVTGRAAARRRLLAADHPEMRRWAEGSLLFHCALLIVRWRGAWQVRAAAPSASLREEPYASELMARYGLRGFVGLGGLGVRTLAALARLGGAYLHVAPGLAQALARTVVRVEGAALLSELGPAEAVWCLEVEDLPAVVTMDAHGQSLHALRRQVREAVESSGT